MIYNIRDGILILLRQRPASDAISSEKPETLQFYLYWATDQIWFLQMLRQRQEKNIDPDGTSSRRKYEMMPPKLISKTLNSAAKKNDLRFIFVPEIGTREDPLEHHALGVVRKCLSSIRPDMTLPRYGGFGSFFPAGSWCSNALLSISPNSYVANFLARHKSGGQRNMNHKTLVGVHIIELDNSPAGKFTPTLAWEIKDFHQSDAGCAESWGKIPIGDSLPLRVSSGAGAESSAKGKGKGKGKEKEVEEVVPLNCYPEIMRQWQPEAFSMPPAQGSDVEMAEDSDDKSDSDYQSSSSDASSSERMSVDSDTERAAQALFNLGRANADTRLQYNPSQPAPAPAGPPGQGSNTGNTGNHPNNPGPGPAAAGGSAGTGTGKNMYDPA